MIKVLIADDHAIVREGLKQIVAATQDIEVAGEAKDGRETLDKISKENYDVVLLDISMPGMSGLDVLKQLRSQKPLLRVLMLSIYPEEQYAIRTLKAGASGYLTKESAPDELVAAIDHAEEIRIHDALPFRDGHISDRARDRHGKQGESGENQRVKGRPPGRRGEWGECQAGREKASKEH